MATSPKSLDILTSVFFFTYMKNVQPCAVPSILPTVMFSFTTASCHFPERGSDTPALCT